MAELNNDESRQSRGKRVLGLFKKSLGMAEPVKPAKKIDDEFLRTAAERADEAFNRERDNIEAAYNDLEFLAGNQWPDWARRQREAQDRPCLTENRMPQFKRQVTGEMRLMRPAIKVTVGDAMAKPAIAELIAGMIRRIENRSEAKAAYALAADSQVTAGIGHLRVTTEYAEESTANQDIRIVQVEDGVSVLWDTNAILPTREDAEWCLVPVDYSLSKFKAKWPHVKPEDFRSYDKQYASYWYGDNRVRAAEYWEKRKATRKLAFMTDGSSVDLTGKTDAEVEAVRAGPRCARIDDRDGHKIFRSLITLGAVLEEAEEWAGRYIPIVPLMGEEIRIGRRIVRHGVIRFAKDPQILYNMGISAQAEIIALAPKAPFIGTDKNFAEHEDEWASANTQAFPYLRYTPDPRNGMIPPQRNAPPVGSPAISEFVMRADGGMKATTGIYDAGLGNRSNETSGIAIRARQNESDVGTVTYSDNLGLTIRHVGRVVVDLLPHVYDTERHVEVEDHAGNVDLVPVNKAMASADIPQDEPTDESDDGAAPVDYAAADNSGLDIVEDDMAQNYLDEDDAPKVRGREKVVKGPVLNDLTVGCYSVDLEMGPSYSSRREEAKDGMQSFIQAVPAVAPLILDLYARAQDWPMAAEIADRIVTTLPPPVQAMIAAKRQKTMGEIPNGGAPQPPGPPPPSPEQLKQMVDQAVAQNVEAIKSQAAARTAELTVRGKELDIAGKGIDLQIAQAKAAAETASLQATAAGHDQIAAVLQQTIKELSTELAHQRGMIEEIVSQLPHPEAVGHDPLAAVLQQTIKELSTELAHQRGMIEEIVSQLPHPEAVDGAADGAPQA